MPINCLKCYRVHRCGDDLYYCPFFAVNPCIRGEHYVPLGASEHKKPLLQPQPKKIPEFKPVRKMPNGIDWERYHKDIFTLLNDHIPDIDIAKKFGINVLTLRNYIGRYY